MKHAPRAPLRAPLLAALSAFVLASAAHAAPSKAALAPVLEIYALDIWGQPLRADLARVQILKDGAAVPGAAIPLSRLRLGRGVYRVTVAAPDHVTAVVDVASDGRRLGAPRASVGAAVSVAATDLVLRAGEGPRNVQALYVGLRHQWFAAHGRPARWGNDLTLLMGGEEAWSTIHRDLLAAKSSVLMSTWWWESDFELVRDPQKHPFLSSGERSRNAVLNVLRSIPARKRVLVNQFLAQDGLLSWMTADDDLRWHGSHTGDNFEFMGQANPTRGVVRVGPAPILFADVVRARVQGAAGRRFAAEQPIAAVVQPRTADLTRWPIKLDVAHSSFHQKFGVIDHKLAYIGGMNFRRVDWDTLSHRVFEPRRMLSKATRTDREAVLARKKKPDTGPRKDYVLRIVGPSAQDAADVFKTRWDANLRAKAHYADKSTAFEVVRNLPASPTGAQAQVTATLPPPWNEVAILESWLNAVRAAREYIYIEDQYFRMPVVNDAIAARMRENPTLRLVVITKPVSEWTDPGCYWTAKSHEVFKAFGPRYRLYQLRSFSTAPSWGWDNTEGRFADIDTHAKILIVDDTFLSVGSANKNNRGLFTEGELNVAVVDRGWVKAQRKRIISHILGGTPAGDDAASWWNQLGQLAQWNDGVFARWKKEHGDIRLKSGESVPAQLVPRGFLYSLDIRAPKKCFIEGVGPDMT